MWRSSMQIRSEFCRSMISWPILSTVLACLLIFDAAWVRFAPAQEPSAAPSPEEDLGGTTPRSAVRSFLEACNAGDYARAATCLNLGSIPGKERAERGPILARHLKAVLDQTLWVELDSLSDRPEGETDDGLPPGLEQVGSVSTSRGKVEILLQHILAEDGKGTWVFASSTVRFIPALYTEYGYGMLGDLLPAPFFTVRFLAIQLWQWIGLFLIMILSLAVALVVRAVFGRIMVPIALRTATDFDDKLIALASKPATLFIALLCFTAGSRVLRLSVPVHEVLGLVEKVLAVVIVTWFFLRLADVTVDVVRHRLESQGRRSLAAMLPLGRRTVKVLMAFLALVVMLQSLGFNVTGLVAGLGVGGLAVALAAQKTLENLFGGVTLTADQPVRVGDFCRFGDKVGTIEDIGLRSTRVRTLDRTLVTIPNSEFSQLQIENFAARDRIRLYLMLGLRYETSPDQLRHVLIGLRKLLLSHPKVHSEPARVRFVGFGAHSLDLEVFAYILTQDYNEFLAIREDIMLRMMDTVGESGSGFAFPSQTIYVGRDDGLDRERSREAEKMVGLMKEKGTLPFPDFMPQTVAEIDDSLDYPPLGSVTRNKES
jgi:MscS family membrane protein